MTGKPHRHASSSPRVVHPDLEDPYIEKLDNEIELAATRSDAAFQQCRDRAVHGDVKIAFQVLPDGHTTHVAAVEDTTGAPQLASCLAAVIARWSFAEHPSAARDFVRTFTYP